MNRFTICLFCLIPLFASGQKIAPDRSSVMASFGQQDKKNFAEPAKINYPETWFHFVDGNVEKQGITKDLEAIAAAGISGVQFFHGGNFGGGWPGIQEHVYCLSEKWEDILHHTASEANRLGLRFTMQNCPGWSMAGGPWITKENAMRVLSWTRTDVEGGTGVSCELPVTASDMEEDADYRDLYVLAFRRPLDDNPECVKPSDVVSDSNSEKIKDLLSGIRSSMVVEEGVPVDFKVFFPSDTVIRSFVMNNSTDINHSYSYEQGIDIKIEAVTADGASVVVLDTPYPQGAWQDPAPTVTFALDEAKARELHVTISHQHQMNISTLRFLTAARKNSWESEAGWDLRSIPYASERPFQDTASFIPIGGVIDITSKMDATGMLRWDAPEGDWVVLRIGHVNSRKKNAPAPNEATGWECDKLSPEGVDAQFDGYIGKYSDGAVKGLLSGMLLDSWECCTQTWTRGMEEKFRDYTGYDLKCWIPALFGYVVGDQRTTFKFLRDWRYTINHLLVENFYGKMAEKAKAKGLYVQYETSGGDVYPMDIMEYYKYADVPMTEFWHNSTSANYVGSINFKPVRPAASAGHIYGKTRVSAEAFTSFWLTWNEHFWQLKENANRHFAQGVSHLVFHTYTHNPKADSLVPGTSFGSSIGSPFLRGQTWWKFMPQFTKYLARCTYMLERGIPSSDVLWYLGDDINHKPDQRKNYMDGYNYDYCNADVLFNRLSVKDGRLVTPEGLSYSVLWYPSAEVITPQTLHRLIELVSEGAVLVTDCPSEVATLMQYDEKQFDSEYKQLFGIGSNSRMHQVGKGRVYLDTDIVEALSNEGITADMIVKGADWMHRKIDGADWYFVAAPEGSGFEGKLDIRNTGRVEIWNPVTGEMSEVDAVQADGRTILDVKLERGECVFVVFDHTGISSQIKKPLVLSSRDISRGWKVSFPEGWGAPKSIELDSLIPWKDMQMSAEGRSFSGTAVYTRKVSLPNYSYNRHYILMLGNVDMVASVKVNGKQFTPLWTNPYNVDITSALDKGVNTLEIEVTSGWFNRLVFDAGQDESLRKTWTIAGPKKDSEYVSTGLLGPIMIKETR